MNKNYINIVTVLIANYYNCDKLVLLYEKSLGMEKLSVVVS